MTPTQVFAPLYKRGVKGEVRCWRMEMTTWEQGGEAMAAHRVVSGILGGVETPSGWSYTEPKNVGKKNATDRIAQARSEINNQYQIKIERGYFNDPALIDDVPFTKPMLAQDWEKRQAKVDLSKGVYVQPKLDGIRCIARADGLWTRTGKPITSCAHVVEALAPIFEENPDIEFDGELYNHALRDDFNTITSFVRKEKATPEEEAQARSLIQYHIYDLAIPEKKFSERMDALNALLGVLPVEGVLQRVRTVGVFSRESLDTEYALYIQDGYEGQMIRLNDVYENKRSNFLMKRKDFVTEEFEVTGMEEGNGNWAGAVKRFIIRVPSSKEGVGEATPRGTYESLRDLLESGETPNWATVRFFGRTPDGALRFPVAVDYGYGKRVD